jgi:hypothetical protein
MMAESCSPEDMPTPEVRELTTRAFTNHDHRSATDDASRFEQFETFGLNPESRVCKREVSGNGSELERSRQRTFRARLILEMCIGLSTIENQFAHDQPKNTTVFRMYTM